MVPTQTSFIRDSQACLGSLAQLLKWYQGMVLLIIPVLFSALFLSPTDAKAQTIPRYGVFDLTLTASGVYSNPYLMMPGDDNTPGFVTGTFTGPNGESITIDGFWDGGNTWKIRMAPTAVGTWTYTSTSPDPGLNGHNGTFDVIASSSKGFIRVDPNHPHHFMYDDGTPFFWLGVNAGGFHHIHWTLDKQTSSFSEGLFQQITDARANQNFTVFDFVNELIQSKPQGTDFNEGGQSFPGLDYNTINPAYYKSVDDRIAYANSKGIVMAPGLGWPDSGITSIPEHQLKRAWRYMIARYSAFNIVWVLFGETNDAGASHFSLAQTYGNLTKTWDPYAHLITTHPDDPNTTAEFDNEPWLDFHMEQNWSNTNYFLPQNKPSIVAETGVESSSSADSFRDDAWIAVMKGAHYGYLYAPGGSLDNLVANLQTPGMLSMKRMAQFFIDRTDFNRLEPAQSLVNQGLAKANPGVEYVVYLPVGVGSVTIDLSGASGSLSLEWYNPRTGGYTGQSTTTGGGSRSFTAPDSQDWVLHITGSSSGADTTPPLPPTNLKVIQN